MALTGAAGLYFSPQLQDIACDGAAAFNLKDGAEMLPNCILMQPLSGAAEEEEEEAGGGKRPDHPGDAVAFRLKRMKNEKGVIPFDGAVRASEEIAALQKVSSFESATESAEKRGVKHGKWTSLGPGNVGGRTRSIAIHPTNSKVMWLGSVGGGIWKTTDGGVTWKPLNDFMANLAVSTIVVNKANPKVLYAGTGEGFYSGDALRGAGIFKTTDGGTTWKQLSSTNNTDFQYVNRIAISTDGTELLAATRSGVFRSTDGGASWAQTDVNDTYDVDIDPTDNTKAIAGGRFGRAYFSTDGGVTWTQATPLFANSNFVRTEVAYAPSSPSTVYLSVDLNGGELYKSTNGGQSYSKVSTGVDYLGQQGWYANALWVSPVNANFVIVGGLDLWRSSNGGTSFTQISNWQNAPVTAHADHHFIIADPNFNGTSNKTVFFGNDGGIYKAADVTAASTTSGWKELNNTLGITQFYSAAGDAKSGNIIGGTQDNGTIFFKPTTGSEKWTRTEGGDGGASAADPTNPKVFYGEYVFANLHRSMNGGKSVSYIAESVPDTNLSAPCAEFIAPFTLDPNNANRMLLGGCSLWRSNNVKAAASSVNWTEIKPDLADNSDISAIAVAKGNADFIVVGNSNGRLFRTSNGTAASPTWTEITGLPARYVTSIAIGLDKKTVYVTFGGFEADNIWKSTNGGASFSKAVGSGSTKAPTAPVYSIVIDPSSKRQAWIYAGTEVGVIASEDGGKHWFSPYNGPARVSVDQVVFVGNKLIAATHGRGLFSTIPVDLP